MLKNDNELDIYDSSWKIYSVNPDFPPHYIGNDAKIKNSLIVEGCVVLGDVINSVLFPGVSIGKNSKIINSVIMQGTHIGNNCIVDKAIIGNDAFIEDNSVVNNSKEIAVVSENKRIKGCFE